MSVEAEAFDASRYYATRPILKLVPGLALGKMMEAASKFGRRFWGLDRGLPIAPIPDDIQNRLLFFKKVLATAPDIDSETYKWAHGTAAAIEDRGETALGHKIVLQRERKKTRNKPAQPHKSKTYAEALQDPDVLYEAYGTMLEKDKDPVARAIASLEDFRLNDESHAPSSLYLNLGFTAFELALLSIREERAKELIGNAAVSRHVLVTE